MRRHLAIRRRRYPDFHRRTNPPDICLPRFDALKGVRAKGAMSLCRTHRLWALISAVRVSTNAHKSFSIWRGEKARSPRRRRHLRVSGVGAAGKRASGLAIIGTSKPIPWSWHLAVHRHRYPDCCRRTNRPDIGLSSLDAESSNQIGPVAHVVHIPMSMARSHIPAAG